MNSESAPGYRSFSTRRSICAAKPSCTRRPTRYEHFLVPAWTRWRSEATSSKNEPLEMSGQRVIALLGRPDAPTDAVEEYCRYLGEALAAEDFELTVERVAWPQKGWSRAASGLRRRAKGWRGAWVLVQYTALAWSARGFPLRFPRVLTLLKAAGARVGVSFRDAAVFTVPMEKISWIKRQPGKGCFIPVGANLATSGEANSRRGITTG